jgi:hypothetical protein
MQQYWSVCEGSACSTLQSSSGCCVRMLLDRSAMCLFSRRITALLTQRQHCAMPRSGARSVLAVCDTATHTLKLCMYCTLTKRCVTLHHLLLACIWTCDCPYSLMLLQEASTVQTAMTQTMPPPTEVTVMVLQRSMALH